MNPLAPPETGTSEEAGTATPAANNRVEGRDPKTVRLKREYEAQVEKKVASDYSHIVWAYGVIWALFAIYGVILWRRTSAQRADLASLAAKLDGRG